MDVVAALARAIELGAKSKRHLGSVFRVDAGLAERLNRIPTKLGPYGVDPFGFDPDYVKRVGGVVAWLYRHYFRCQTVGVENIPDGRCLVVANHSGQLPFDGMMVSAAVFLEREPPRYLRSMLDRFVPSTPYVSVFLARMGQILGTPENCTHLLGSGVGILVFPEGVRGLNKTWDERYKLQGFGQGFMRLALETKTPIVPTVVIGAEEQAPSVASLGPLARLLGMPAFPVTPTFPWLTFLGLLPLPSRYRIYFGEPIYPDGNANDEDDVIQGKVEEVRGIMQQMIETGLGQREHVFW